MKTNLLLYANRATSLRLSYYGFEFTVITREILSLIAGIFARDGPR